MRIEAVVADLDGTLVGAESAGTLLTIAKALDGVVGAGMSRVAGRDVLHITSLTAGKGVAVLRALAMLGAQPAATVSFGDMPNDLPMFAVTGRAYAVGCMHPDVAASAVEILAPVGQDGFAAKIRAHAASAWSLV